MTEISFLILGLILGSLPLIVLYLKKKFILAIAECKATSEDLQETLKKLNALHNGAAQTNEILTNRVLKLESELSQMKMRR